MTAPTIEDINLDLDTVTGGHACESWHPSPNNICTNTAVAIAQSCLRPGPFLVCAAWCAFIAEERRHVIICIRCQQHVRDCWNVVML